MIHSMTGYGSGRAAEGATSVAVELSSVNHKQRDFRFSIPAELSFLESQLKTMLSDTIIRGSLGVIVTYELAPNYRAACLQIDKDFAGHIIRQFEELRNEFNLAGELRLSDLATVPGIIVERPDSLPRGLISKLARNAISLAITQLQEARRQEGCAIEKDLMMRVKRLEKKAAVIEKGRDETLSRYRDNLRDRIAEMGVELNDQDERVAREVAVAAQKADITEEIVRLQSHLTQFREILTDGQTGSGRQLQFISQELLREINTLAAKTHQVSVARDAIDFKAELDRIREQVCNIE